jgi:hypothetical protein
MKAAKKAERVNWGDAEMMMAVTMLIFVLVAAFRLLLG